MKLNIDSLTLTEKLRLLTGKDWWHLEDLDGKLPVIELQDGPNGLRRAVYEMVDGKLMNKRYETATAMPTLSLVASTWNTELARLQAEVIADEFTEYEKDVILGPGVNIKRTPLCGRNFEYFSEDPYLAGTMGKAYIKGANAKGVGSCVKHYCANNSDYDRHYQSSEVDERTLREIYLAPFEIAMEAEPPMLMSSYNPINGVYASENKWLLSDILRDEFGYGGLVVSDWLGVHESARAHKAGLDLEMPYRNEAYEELMAACESGAITIDEIDAEVKRVVGFLEKIADMRASRRVEYTHEERHAAARRIAEEGIVLLKNEGGDSSPEGRQSARCGSSCGGARNRRWRILAGKDRIHSSPPW